MTSLRLWYIARSAREKRLLLLLLALVLPTIGWLAVLALNGAYDAALRDHLAAADRNGRVRALAESARATPASQRSSAQGDLVLIVTDSAAQRGVQLQGTTPTGPNTIDVQVAGSPATSVTQWLRELEARGISVAELRMSPGSDRTIAVAARLTRGR